MRRRPRNSRGAGMVLAEAMVAIAILGAIGMLTYGTFARTLEARERAGAITRHYHEVRQAMLRMSRELSMAYLTRHKDCSDLRNDTMFVVSHQGGAMRVDFTSFGHTKTRRDANESDANELSYYLDGDPERPNETVLVRREQARVDEDPQEGGREDVLAHGVTELRFEVYDPREDRWDEEWDSTNLDYRNRLPMFVRIELKVKAPSGQEETFVTKTRVQLQNAIQVMGTGFAAPAEGC